MSNAARTVISVALVLCAGLSATGCATAEPKVSSPASWSLPTEVSSAPSGAETLPWTLVSSKGRAVVIATGNEGCLNPGSFMKTETSHAVRITVFARHIPEPCASVGFSVDVTVHLDDPLGHRTIEGGGAT